MTNGMVHLVSADEWVQACRTLADQGTDVADWLTAIDTAGSLMVLVHLVCPGTGESALIGCHVDSESPQIASLTPYFAGVDWHERETSEMFGIEFIGRASTDPLLLRTAEDPPPLRKRSPLPARVETPWPGREESEKKRRRRTLPPGVREEWVSDE